MASVYLKTVCQLPHDGGLPVTSIFAGGFLASVGGACAPRHLCICRRFASYPTMKGYLSPLYLQAVCQLPRWWRAPWHLRVFADSCQLRHNAGLPVTSIFARGLTITLLYQAYRNFCFCRRFANYPVVPGSLPPIYALSWSLQSAFFTVALWISIIYWAVLHKYVVGLINYKYDIMVDDLYSILLVNMTREVYVIKCFDLQGTVV
jgi:hypothetical protein